MKIALIPSNRSQSKNLKYTVNIKKSTSNLKKTFKKQNQEYKPPYLCHPCL